MAKVKFLPSGVEVEVSPDETLFSAARRAGVPIATICGGAGSCSSCRVRIVEGEQHLSEMGYTEKSRLGNTFFITKERLACQTRTTGDLVVEVLMERVRDKRDRSRKRALDRTLENARRREQRAQERKAKDEARRKARDAARGGATPRGDGHGAGEAKGDGDGRQVHGATDEPPSRRKRRRRRRPRRAVQESS